MSSEWLGLRRGEEKALEKLALQDCSRDARYRLPIFDDVPLDLTSLSFAHLIQQRTLDDGRNDYLDSVQSLRNTGKIRKPNNKPTSLLSPVPALAFIKRLPPPFRIEVCC